VCRRTAILKPPIDQRDPDAFLEAPHITAKCLLGHEEPGRGPAEVQFIGHRDEMPQQSHIEVGPRSGRHHHPGQSSASAR